MEGQEGGEGDKEVTQLCDSAPTLRMSRATSQIVNVLLLFTLSPFYTLINQLCFESRSVWCSVLLRVEFLSSVVHLGKRALAILRWQQDDSKRCRKKI